ncbi:MAG: hypothetical protein ACLRMZ_20925 [Blautia marasmi]
MKNTAQPKAFPDDPAGASCDDIYVIVLFSTFSTMAQGGSAHLKDFIIRFPILGIALGSVAGYLLSLFSKLLMRTVIWCETA